MPGAATSGLCVFYRVDIGRLCVVAFSHVWGVCGLCVFRVHVRRLCVFAFPHVWRYAALCVSVSTLAGYALFCARSHVLGAMRPYAASVSTLIGYALLRVHTFVRTRPMRFPCPNSGGSGQKLTWGVRGAQKTPSPTNAIKDTNVRFHSFSCSWLNIHLPFPISNNCTTKMSAA